MGHKLPYPVYDADHHLYETPEAFLRHLPKKYKNAFRYVNVDGRTKLAIGNTISDFIPNPTFDKVAAPGTLVDFFMGNNPEGKTQREFVGQVIEPEPDFRFAEARQKKLVEQEIDGALVFPTLAAAVEQRLNYNLGAMTAVMHSLNQYILEEWGFHNDRIYTAPVISLADLDWAVNELEWALKNGARTVLIRPAPVPNPTGSRSLGFEEFDPFWARVNEAGIFISMHGSDCGYDSYVQAWRGGDEFLPFDEFNDPFATMLKPTARAIYDTMAALVCHGVFNRHPNVRVAAIEIGAAWVGELLTSFEKVHKQLPMGFKTDPVEQFREHVFIVPFYEDNLTDLRELIGAKQILFATDYPHPEGLLNPEDFLQYLDGFSEDDTKRIMGGSLKALLEGRAVA